MVHDIVGSGCPSISLQDKVTLDPSVGLAFIEETMS